MSNIRDLSHTIIPKSDQLNADTLLGGAITITVNDVRDNGDDQPIVVYFDGDSGRPYKPCKSMRKVLLFAWGKDGTQWIGRSMTIYTDPEVMFGGMKVGGIRISHLSHIERDIQIALTATKGKKAQHMIKRLVLQDAEPAASNEQVEAARVQALNASRKGKKAFGEVWNSMTKGVRRQLGQDFKNSCMAAATDYDESQKPDHSAGIAALARASERAEAKQAAVAAAPVPEPEPELPNSEPAHNDDDIFQVD